jgi:hypothetical protein
MARDEYASHPSHPPTPCDVSTATYPSLYTEMRLSCPPHISGEYWEQLTNSERQALLGAMPSSDDLRLDPQIRQATESSGNNRRGEDADGRGVSGRRDQGSNGGWDERFVKYLAKGDYLHSHWISFKVDAGIEGEEVHDGVSLGGSLII